MESKIKKYELNQNGKKYILSIQIFGEKLRFACIEHYQEKQTIFIGEFTLDVLMQISPVFSNLTEISKALEIFDSLILNQKVNIKLENNFLFLNILIKKENLPDEKFSIKLILFNGIKKEDNIQVTEKKIITSNIISNQYNESTDNNINENLIYSPTSQNIEQVQHTQAINEQIIKSPIINNETHEQQLINSPVNINSISNGQLIQSPNVDTNTNIITNYQEQLILSPNHTTNINTVEQQYTTTTGDINATSNEQFIQSSQEQNINSQDIYSQEKQDIQITNDSGDTSANDYIQQFLQSSGSTSSQEQYITDQSPLNIEQYLQKSEENVNTNQQYTQDYNFNFSSQDNQASNIEIPSQTQNNVEINQTTTTNTESQYIQQPAETTTNINSYESYFQQPTSNITTENTYIQNIQQPSTITSNTTTTQTHYVQIPTTKITTQKQYIVQNQPLESQTVNYNITQNQMKKTKKIKTEKIVLSLLPQPKEEPVQPIIEETNYESSAQIYEPIKQPEIQTPQIIVQDNPELDNLRAENARLKEEIELLRNQMNVYIEENKTLKSNTVIKSEIPTNNQEILLLREEIERMRIELSRFEEYKLSKEDEINMLNIKIQTLLSKLKELEKMNSDLRAYIEKLQQIKSGSEDVHQGESLTIQDTRLEIIRGDIIESPKELELLTRRMCNNQYKKISLNLLYKAIIDSDKASVFHKKCDSAQCTLVLVRSGNGKRFGGFTSCNWQGNSIEKKDNNAFIFSLDKLKIYDVIEGEDAIGCYPNFGPVFLGCQIRIYDEFFKKGGSTYEKGLNYDTEEDFELTGGLKTFEVKDIEVYSVELFQQ